MSGHGGRRSGSGRKRIYSSEQERYNIWNRGHTRIALDNIVYSSWYSAKIKCGCSSDSDFASHLLSLELRRRQNDPVVSSGKRKRSEAKENLHVAKRPKRHIEGQPLSSSTPLKPTRSAIQSPDLSLVSVGNASTSDVDVTGITEYSVNNSSYIVVDGSVILPTDEEKYPETDSSSSEIESDDETMEETERPFKDAMQDALEELEDDQESTDSFSDISDVNYLEHSLSKDEDDFECEINADDYDHDESFTSDVSPHSSALFPDPLVPPAQQAPVSTTNQKSGSAVTSSATVQPTPIQPASSSTITSSATVQPTPIQPAASSTTTSSATVQPTPIQPTTSSTTTSSATVQPTPIQPAASSTTTSSATVQPTPIQPAASSTTTSSATVQPTPIQPAASSTSTAVIPTYPRLSRLEEQTALKNELSLVRQTKVICSLDLLINIFKKCQHPGCIEEATIKHHLNGPTAIIHWVCPAGHKGTFASSKDENGMYCNNLQFAASIMLSGNNFAKVEKLANFLGLACISDSTFYRMQRLYFLPAIEEWWGWQRGELLKDFVDEEVVVCGDGQCDSPGHTAKNLCYFLMELVSGYILEIEVRDKRHVGLASSNMERQALQNALRRLKASLNIVEVVTDASSTIKKLLADNFSTVFHSLDVWHKSKSIRKCLAKVSHLKGMEKIQAWSDHIILHFWHCANICKANESTTDDEALDKMKNTWIGLLHHVCDEHDWTGGSCEHGELEEHELPWFDRRDKDFEALRKVVLDPQLLASFKYYVRFRHTGSLECANNLSLVYTPKRCSYSYRSYKSRKQLTAIDWNYHLNQEVATNKAGDIIVSRKYNQRTKEWNSRVIKVKKEYQYIPVLMAKIMERRKEDANKVTRNVPLNDSDPALLAPTIAAKPPPPSKELYLARISRFAKASSDEGSTNE